MHRNSYVAVALMTAAQSFAAPKPTIEVRELKGRTPDFEFSGPKHMLRDLHTVAKRQGGGFDYNQNYNAGGQVNFNPTSDGYTLDFSGVSDIVVGKGFTTGSSDL
jgi:hypothetical protein